MQNGEDELAIVDKHPTDIGQCCRQVRDIHERHVADDGVHAGVGDLTQRLRIVQDIPDAVIVRMLLRMPQQIP